MRLSAESYDRDIAEHARSPRIRRLLAMWEGYARGKIPSITDLMEAGLGELADHYALLVPDGPGRFTYLYYGRAIQRATGVERTGVTTDNLPPVLREYLVRLYSRALDEARPIYIVNVAHARPHVDTWERLVVPVRTNGDQCMLVILAEPHELRESVSNAIIEASPDGIIALRAIEDDLGTIYDAKIVTLNESACRISRRSREQLLYGSFLQAFPQVAKNGIWDICLEVIETRTAARFDIHAGLSLADGHYRFTLSPLYGGLAMMFQDVTDLAGDAIPLIGRRASNVQHFAVSGLS